MTKEYEAVILAAGRGSRLSDRTAEVPKALLPIGHRGSDDPVETTFLRRQVELLKEAGVDRVVVVIGYAGHQIADELAEWASWVRIVENPTPDIQTSGSLHSFQFAIRSEHGVLDGSRQTLLMDADITYHRDVLGGIIDSPADSTLLVCDRFERNNEEVLVYGEAHGPRFLGKGLTDELVGGLPCLGEATGIVKIAPQDHSVARASLNWLLGNPEAPQGTLRHKGFGPARRATEHEELTQRLMLLGRMRASVFSGDELPFMEVDTLTEYLHLREVLYPRLLELEAES